MKSLRGLSIVLIGITLVTGPLAPVAWAEHEQSAPASGEEPGAGHKVGAAATNVIYVPGKVVLCTLGGVVGLALLVITFGSGYGAAASAVQEGCGGAWTITAEDLKRAQEERRGSMSSMTYEGSAR